MVCETDATVVMPRVALQLVAPPKASQRPEWIRHGTHHVVDELKLYFRTLWDFARAPKATAAAWATGEYKAINPLNYFLKSFAIVAPWRAFWWAKFGFHGGSPAVNVGAAFGAYFFLFIVTFGNPLFRVLRARGGVSGSWAVAMYVLGGIPTFASLLIEPLTLLSRRSTEITHNIYLPGLTVHYAPGGGVVQIAAISASIIVFVAYWVYLTSALAGVHGISRRRSVAALVGATAALVGLIIALAPVLKAIGVLRTGG